MNKVELKVQDLLQKAANDKFYIALLREKCPQRKIIVGGAVLTEEHAATIGADKYAADAMEAVRYAESVEKEIKNLKAILGGQYEIN